jgi:hypothetical protein
MINNKIIHLIVSVICFAIPLVLTIHGTWQDITVGAVLNAIYLYVSQKVNPTQPRKV